jgi:hypothetical protein
MKTAQIRADALVSCPASFGIARGENGRRHVVFAVPLSAGPGGRPVVQQVGQQAADGGAGVEHLPALRHGLEGGVEDQASEFDLGDRAFEDVEGGKGLGAGPAVERASEHGAADHVGGEVGHEGIEGKGLALCDQAFEPGADRIDCACHEAVAGRDPHGREAGVDHAPLLAPARARRGEDAVADQRLQRAGHQIGLGIDIVVVDQHGAGGLWVVDDPGCAARPAELADPHPVGAGRQQGEQVAVSAPGGADQARERRQGLRAGRRVGGGCHAAFLGLAGCQRQLHSGRPRRRFAGRGMMTTTQLFQMLVVLHVATGAVGLVAFWVPLLARKGGPAHKRFGRLFNRLMLATAATAILMALLNLHDPAGTHPHIADPEFTRNIFGWMMLYLGVLTVNLTLYGWNALLNRRDHGANRSPANVALQALLLVLSFNTAIRGVLVEQPLMIGISTIGFATVGTNLWFMLTPRPQPVYVLREHVKGLIGTGISVYTAFLAFGAVRFVPELALHPGLWAIPLVTGLATIIWHWAQLNRAHAPRTQIRKSAA